MSEVILATEGVSKTFHKGKQEIPVIRQVDFELRRGESVALVGPSGAGKSTFLHLLGTLEKPTEGRIVYSGTQDLTRANDKDLARFRNQKLGFVFQFHHLLPEFTALENVMMPALIAGLSVKEVEPQASELLSYVGLSHRLQHRPSELSGGEQQRVAIARAVMLKPEVLMADELTGNLDSENSARVVELLADLNQRLGISIVLVTHDRDLAAKMKRVYEMRDGKLIGQA